MTVHTRRPEIIPPLSQPANNRTPAIPPAASYTHAHSLTQSMTSSPRPQSDETGSSVAGARALVAQRPVCDCYPDGHLRALRATTWPEDPTSPRRILYGGRRSALTTNVPLPFVMPGADTVYVELWFHVGPQSPRRSARGKLGPRASL
ncbi:uncharacterized protein LOC122243824 [Penaeus japonicus]|uniref:uncharacterized protein LOC122243824 n=1 Tax=Penaeus japonicus TaxID=27405 RepID=UPI001C7152BF|nr:uncharacterized protein LOC122243824 [Penaeus japonicus]